MGEQGLLAPGAVPTAGPLSGQGAIDAFRTMLLIRLLEERIVVMVTHREIQGVTSVAVGQEATCVATALATEADDLVFTTHRNHGHVLARGGDPAHLMAEMMGKDAGMCHGKGGSFHIAAPSIGVPASSAIVGAAGCVGVGAALSFKQRGEKRVAVACQGERTLTEGSIWESLNLAAWWQVPLVFLCENNDAIPYTTEGALLATDRFTNLPKLLGFQTQEVDGADLWATYEAVKAAADRARAGGGPTFIEAQTTHWPGTTSRVVQLIPGPTRLADMFERPPSDEHDEWRDHEPIGRTVQALLAAGLVDRPALEKIEREVTEQVDAAAEFARQAPFPDAERAFSDVFA